jgi:transposase-like protein
MNVIARLLERLAYHLGGAIALTGHVVIVRDDCPHCATRTLCEVSVLHQHYRCLECGRSIREPKERPEVSRRTDETDLVAA